MVEFSGHPQHASRGHLCDSTAFLFHIQTVCTVQAHECHDSRATADSML